MEAKETPFLDFYIECIASKGKMPRKGLCRCGLPMRVLNKFRPTFSDNINLRVDFFPTGFWAHGEVYDGPFEFDDMTKLRATILLFCAALNNEL